MIGRLARRSLLTLPVVAVLWALLIGSAGKAMAHADFLRSEPEAGSVVEQLPSKVRIKFSEPVDAPVDAIRVTGPDGASATDGPARVAPEDATVLEVPIKNRGKGTYTVVWRAISADGHPVGGSFTFGLGVVPVIGAPGASDPTGLALLAFSRWMHLVALVLALGPLAYVLLVRPGPMDAEVDLKVLQLAFLGILMLLVASVVMLLGEATAVGGSLGAALSAGVVSSVLVSRWGLLWASRLGLSTILALGVIFAMGPAGEGRAVPKFWWISLLALGSGLLVLTSLNGHAAVTEPVGLSLFMDVLHLGSATAWIGVLATFVLVGLRHRKANADGRHLTYLAPAFLKISNVSVVALQIVVVSGFYSAWMQVKFPDALLTAQYGRVLTAKMVAVGLVMLVGAYHFLKVRPRLEAAMGQEAARAGRGLPRWSMQLELLGGAAILALAALLTSLPPVPGNGPPSTVQPSVEPALSLADNAGSTMVILSLAPAKPGANEVQVHLSDLYGSPVNDVRVTVEARNLEFPSQGGVTGKAEALGNGTYRVSLYLAGEGRWTFQVVLEAGGSPQSASFSLRLPVPGAAEILSLADRTMNGLSTMMGEETLTDGRAVVRSRYELVAPDKMHLVVSGVDRRETIAIGRVRYDRVGSGEWSKEAWPTEDGFRWPDYRFSATAENVLLLGREPVGDVECFVVAFRDGPSGAMYRMWIGVTDYLIRQYRMVMPGHYMEVHFSGFNAPLDVAAPLP